MSGECVPPTITYSPEKRRVFRKLHDVFTAYLLSQIPNVQPKPQYNFVYDTRQLVDTPEEICRNAKEIANEEGAAGDLTREVERIEHDVTYPFMIEVLQFAYNTKSTASFIRIYEEIGKFIPPTRRAIHGSKVIGYTDERAMALHCLLHCLRQMEHNKRSMSIHICGNACHGKSTLRFALEDLLKLRVAAAAQPPSSPASEQRKSSRPPLSGDKPESDRTARLPPSPPIPWFTDKQVKFIDIKEGRTKGLDISQLEDALNCRYVVYDYGGQEEYQVNHKMFLANGGTVGSTYILVLGILDVINKCFIDTAKITETYTYWIKFLRMALCDRSPRFLVVVNSFESIDVSSDAALLKCCEALRCFQADPLNSGARLKVDYNKGLISSENRGAILDDWRSVCVKLSDEVLVAINSTRREYQERHEFYKQNLSSMTAGDLLRSQIFEACLDAAPAIVDVRDKGCVWERIIAQLPLAEGETHHKTPSCVADVLDEIRRHRLQAPAHREERPKFCKAVDFMKDNIRLPLEMIVTHLTAKKWSEPDANLLIRDTMASVLKWVSDLVFRRLLELHEITAVADYVLWDANWFTITVLGNIASKAKEVLTKKLTDSEESNPVFKASCRKVNEYARNGIANSAIVDEGWAGIICKEDDASLAMWLDSIGVCVKQPTSLQIFEPADEAENSAVFDKMSAKWSSPDFDNVRLKYGIQAYDSHHHIADRPFSKAFPKDLPAFQRWEDRHLAVALYRLEARGQSLKQDDVDEVASNYVCPYEFWFPSVLLDKALVFCDEDAVNHSINAFVEMRQGFHRKVVRRFELRDDTLEMLPPGYIGSLLVKIVTWVQRKVARTQPISYVRMQNSIEMTFFHQEGKGDPNLVLLRVLAMVDVKKGSVLLAIVSRGNTAPPSPSCAWELLYGAAGGDGEGDGGLRGVVLASFHPGPCCLVEYCANASVAAALSQRSGTRASTKWLRKEEKQAGGGSMLTPSPSLGVGVMKLESECKDQPDLKGYYFGTLAEPNRMDVDYDEGNPIRGRSMADVVEGMRVITEASAQEAFPRTCFIIAVPTEGKKSKWMLSTLRKWMPSTLNPLKLFKKEMRLLFFCPKSRRVMPCGLNEEKGHGYKLFYNKAEIEPIMPFVKLGAAIANAFIQSQTGVRPIPMGIFGPGDDVGGEARDGFSHLSWEQIFSEEFKVPKSIDHSNSVDLAKVRDIIYEQEEKGRNINNPLWKPKKTGLVHVRHRDHSEGSTWISADYLERHSPEFEEIFSNLAAK